MVLSRATSAFDTPAEGHMLPYQDSVARRYPPVVVWVLLAANILIFLYQVSLPPPALEAFIFEYGLVPSRYLGDLRLIAPATDWLPFLTNTFLHGGWLHLILNMWTLWIFGPAVEDRLGPGRFAVFYLLCGIAASVAHAFSSPQSVVPALGASGAIAGLIGCYARMFPHARLVLLVPILFIPLFVEMSALGFALIWFVMQVVPGVLSLGQEADAGGIACWAHIGGFIVGWLLAPAVRRPRRAYRPHYRDEGAFGFLPDGRR